MMKLLEISQVFSLHSLIIVDNVHDAKIISHCSRSRVGTIRRIPESISVRIIWNTPIPLSQARLIARIIRISWSCASAIRIFGAKLWSIRASRMEIVHIVLRQRKQEMKAYPLCADKRATEGRREQMGASCSLVMEYCALDVKLSVS